jgi:hypothetical protein
MAAGAQNLFGGTPYMGYQVYQAPGGMVAAYDPNTGTFGRLQGNSYVPMSRDEAMQSGLISASTAPALPEQNALGMMGQIDPTGEALRQSLGQSYLSTLGQAPMPTAPTMAQGPSFAGGQAPAAGDVQSYLDLYKQIDPEGYAQHANLATSMDQYVQQMQQQEALGTQLDPETVREITQATRQGQVARGNVYGTPQLMQEAVTRGQAGLAIQQQRQAQLASALGQQQGYLSSGMGLGDIANTLYQQGYARNLSSYQAQQQAIQNQNQQALNLYQAQLGARSGAQSGALGYLGSGQTPLGAASSYIGMGEQAAGAAAGGGPQYNPASLGPTYTGAGASQFPQYGIDTSQLANQWYNSLGAYGGQAAAPNKTGKALSGAATGALSGATAGTAISPGIGTAVGALAGAGLGAASSYYA